MNKKIISFSLAFLMVLSIFPLCLIEVSAASPVAISSAAEFSEIRNNLAGDYIITATELDCSSLSGFTPMGAYSSAPFSGTLTAVNGCVIKNLSVNCENAGTGAGIFAYLTGSVSGLTIDSSCSFLSIASGQHVGSIAGVISGDAEIENCTNNAAIYGSTTWSVGGIAGTATGNAKISDCTNNGAITNAGTGYTAGILAMINSTAKVDITRCKNTGDISNISADVIATNGFTAGIFAYINKVADVNISYCDNSGSVTSGGDAGGIMGFMVYNNIAQNVSVKYSSNSGAITSTGASTYASGILGHGARVKVSTLSIEYCYNTGDITAAYYACGILGQFNPTDNNTNMTITHCYNAGSLRSTSSSEHCVSLGMNQNAASLVKSVVSDLYFLDGSKNLFGRDNTADNSYATSADGMTKLEGNAKEAALYNAVKDWSYTDGTETKALFTAVGSTEVNRGCPVFAWQHSSHTYTTEIICTGTRYICTECGYSYVDASSGSGNHTYGAWETVSAATELLPGSRKRVCSVCGDIQTEAIPTTFSLTPVGKVYTINTAVDLLWFALNINEGDLLLGADIVIDDTSLARLGADGAWTGIGTSSQFVGNIDGAGHTITLKSTKSGGLIEICGNASVKDLTLNANITANGICGALVDTLNGSLSLDRVIINGRVTGDNDCAGFIALASASSAFTIKNCENNAEIKASSVKFCASGFIARSDSDASKNKIENSKNSGSITATDNASGFISRAGGNGVTEITSCSNSGNITATVNNQQAGGIVAYTNCTLTVDKCSNFGTVTSDAAGTGIGGIVGRCNAASKLMTVRNCINYGLVESSAMCYGIVGYLSAGTNFKYENNISFSVAENRAQNTDTAASGDYVGANISGMKMRIDTLPSGKTDLMFEYNYGVNYALFDATGYFDNYTSKLGKYVDGKFTEIDAFPMAINADGRTSVSFLLSDIPTSALAVDYTIIVTTVITDGTGNALASFDISHTLSPAALAREFAADGYKSVDDKVIPDAYKAETDKVVSLCKTVVCIGDSITDGTASSNGPHRGWTTEPTVDYTYPGRLEAILGTAYDVINCGYGGRTLLSTLEKSYMATAEYTEAKNAKADVVIIMLGTNDADTSNCISYGDAFEAAYKAQFMTDAKTIIDAMIAANPAVKIIIATSPESYRYEGTAVFTGQSASRYANTQINLKIVREWQKELVGTLSAQNYSISLLDIHDATDDFTVNYSDFTASSCLEYFATDFLHPNDKGYEYLAGIFAGKVSEVLK